MKTLTAEQRAKPRTRRLRKKLRVGEFQELGLAIDLRFDRKFHHETGVVVSQTMTE